ncbi:MAG: BamA/TamA family outer membrane protein [candidate division Zixibacteria bacterium]|nr:BamA/TamA family outer membrane protein [candidate division Zixibacteria bacterium]
MRRKQLFQSIQKYYKYINFLVLFGVSFLFFYGSVICGEIVNTDFGDNPTIDLTPIIYPKPSGIGLALSGGGAQGFAQIGVLKALEENNIPISHIAGTSIGAVIGGLYASGYSAVDLQRMAEVTDWQSLFSNNPNRLKLFLTQRQAREKHLLEIRFDGLTPYIPQAFTSGQRMTSFLYDITVNSRYGAGADFDRLRIPFRAVATDLVTGETIILASGDLAEAMRASVSVPLAFSPVEYDHTLLVDGGLTEPIPVKVVRGMGANKVIAVNTVSQLDPKDKLNSPFDIANQATSIMVKEKTAELLEQADLVINPDLSKFANTEFTDVAAIIEAGEKAAYAKLPEINNLLGNNQAENSETLFISNFRISSFENANLPEHVNAITRKYQHRNLELSAINALKEELFACGDYISVDARIENSASNTSVVLGLVPSPIISEVRISGNTVFSSDILRKYLQVDEDEKLDASELRRGLLNIENLYRNSHYPLIKFDRIEVNPNSGILAIDIDEGLISDLEIIGSNITRSWLIHRDFPEVVGRPYNSMDIAAGVEKLYNTGLFDYVSTNIASLSNGYYTLRLKFREKHPVAARFGARYDNEYNLQGLIELGNYNIAGTGKELILRGIIGDREQKLRSEFRADRFFNTMITFSIFAEFGSKEMDLYFDHRPRNHYTKDNIAAGFRIGQQISRLGTASLEFHAEDITEEFPDNSELSSDIRSIILRSIVDTKNKNVLPKTGKYHHSYLEFANDVLGGNEVYSKFYISLESYYPLPWGFNFHPRGALGISINGLPHPEKYRLGKPDGFAGYYSNEVLGDNMFFYFLKIRKSLYRNYYLYFRYDTGDVFDDRKEVKLTQLRHGFMIGFVVNTFLGPLDINYGIHEEDIDRVSLSWGYEF